jgi:hypothetical protein
VEKNQEIKGEIGMSLKESIDAKIKEAMINKDAETRDVLRAVKSNANLAAKEAHTDVTDDMFVSAFKKELKMMNQTVASLAGKEDTDLYKSTLSKIKVIESFLPKEMTEEDVKAIVEKIVAGLGDNANFGTKMQAVMKELKGKADGKLIQKVVKGL